MNDILKNYLEHLLGEENVLENEPMSKHTSFKIGGAAKFFVLIKSKELLVKLVNALNFIEQRFFVIGLGCNVLALDKGYDGVVIKLMFNEIVVNANFVYADAGTTLKATCEAAKQAELTGLEFASGIPASVGGAVVMNAGAFGREIADVVTLVDVLHEGRIKTLSVRDCNFKYRNSVFKKQKGWIVLGAYFYLRRGNKDDIIKLEQSYVALRREKQPTLPSAGSVFLRPKGYFAGKLIEDCGLKGYEIGRAQVSPKHAGFIVNNGGAKSKDVLNLIKHIKCQVKQKYNVTLKKEIIILK